MASKTPEKQAPSLGAPCAAFLRTSYKLSFRTGVGLPWSRLSPPFVVAHPFEVTTSHLVICILPRPTPVPKVCSALRHSHPSLALCSAVVLTVYLTPSVLVAPVALSPLRPPSAASCAASGLRTAT